MTGKPGQIPRAARNDTDSSASPGSRPYEMEWRTEDRVPVFGFEDLTGWTVECLGGADAELVRTREQQMWGEYVGKLTYTGTSGDSKVILRPPAPIAITGEFDCVSAWIYGNVWEWAPEPGTPMVDIVILLLDPSGGEHSVYLTRVRWKEWWLAHKKLSAARRDWTFSGIEVRGLSNPEPRSIFFDSIYFYKEVLKPLAFQPRPARNLKLPEGQSPGLNTGPGRLCFPTREDTILPSNFEKSFSNAAISPSPGRYEFRYEGKDCSVSYVYEPRSGGLDEVSAYVNGRKVCLPLVGGGIEFGDGVFREGKLESASLEDGVLTARFGFGGSEAVYRFRIRQKSLLMDFECRGGEATGLALGEFREVENPRLVRVPYITLGAGQDPRVLCWAPPPSGAMGRDEAAEGALFASVWIDWYRSNGSLPWSQEWAQENFAKINGGVRYFPRTDGRRNDLFERVFLTISPTFEETLPTIANPPTPHGKLAGERLWQESWGPDDYAKQHARSRMLRSYGIEKLTQCNHEITWRDGGESFTLRTSAAPGKGGDQALKDYVAKQKSLGWLSGLYTNYCDLAPVNEYWHEDHVQRTPEGELRPAWPRCYALKHSRAVEFDAKLAPIIKSKFGSNAAYTDVHTAASPWGYTDYDARVPGAGTFAATFYAYGELLLNDQKVYGPTWSEGTFQWLYAGLATGNYGLCYGSADLSKEPLNVAFDLLKIHPLELDIGMPWTSGFLKDPGWDKPENIDSSIDHFLAATIAYGHIGWLVEEAYGIQRTCRSYYMLQQLQKRYALRKPVRIEYADSQGRLVGVSEAIATGIIDDSRLHVVYANGLEVFVNGSSKEWKVLDGKRVLPQWGWCAMHRETGFEEFSSIVDGHRIDYVLSPEYEYLDGRGVPVTYGGLGARGSIAVRRAARRIEITDIYGNDEIGIRTGRPGTCVAFDAEGKNLGPVELRPAQDDMVWLKVREGARRYVIQPSRSVAESAISLRLRLDGDCCERTQTLRFPRSDAPQPGSRIAENAFIATACDRVVPGQKVIAALSFSGRAKGVSTASVGFEGMKPVVVSLTGAENGRINAEVPLVVPESTVPGSRLWVRASARSAEDRELEAWYVLTVVPAFEIGLRQTGPGGFRIDLRYNIHGGPEPQVKCALESGKLGLVVEQDQHDPCDVRISLEGEPRVVKDRLVVEVSSDGFRQVREFGVQSVVEHPAVWDLTDKGGFRFGYAYRGGNETGPSTASGATFQIESLACGGVTKRGIFAHPPWIGGVGYTWGITRRVELPEAPCEFRTFIGLRDGGNPSDGVVFTVLAIDDSGREQVLVNENWAKREWKEISADLSSLRGKTIRLKFVTDVGLNDNSTADWACWGEPRIVTRDPVARIEAG